MEARPPKIQIKCEETFRLYIHWRQPTVQKYGRLQNAASGVKPRQAQASQMLPWTMLESKNDVLYPFQMQFYKAQHQLQMAETRRTKVYIKSKHQSFNVSSGESIEWHHCGASTFAHLYKTKSFRKIVTIKHENLQNFL